MAKGKPMFRIDFVGTEALPRLVATARLTAADFDRIAAKLGVAAFTARKTGLVAARKAVTAERIETRWNGKETTTTAQPGDWIATNMGPDATPLRDQAGNLNVYVIPALRFPELYERAAGSTPHGDIYRPRGSVRALALPGGFEILAPWGETQRANAGYLLDNGSEIYGNAKETFEATYRRG